MWIWIKTGYEPSILIYGILIIALIASFGSLNVIVDKEYLRIKFGYGIFRKKYLLKDIASVQAVRNQWYYGWGIRYWWATGMWIFNVSGLDAVEIILKNGKPRRIGTDEPKKLEKAIKKMLK